VSAPANGRDPILVTPDEAARLLSMSRNSWDRYVRPEVRLVRRGRLVLVRTKELERWATQNEAFTLDPPEGH
jgi:hypothetical protein